jgi:hypothetical protein
VRLKHCLRVLCTSSTDSRDNIRPRTTDIQSASRHDCSQETAYVATVSLRIKATYDLRIVSDEINYISKLARMSGSVSVCYFQITLMYPLLRSLPSYSTVHRNHTTQTALCFCLVGPSPRILVLTHSLRDFSPRANYTDRATATCRRSWCQLLRIEGCRMVSAADPLRP